MLFTEPGSNLYHAAPTQARTVAVLLLCIIKYYKYFETTGNIYLRSL